MLIRQKKDWNNGWVTGDSHLFRISIIGDCPQYYQYYQYSSGLRCRDLGGYFGGIGGPAVTMRCRAIVRHAAKDRQLAKDLDRLRHILQNNE